MISGVTPSNSATKIIMPIKAINRLELATSIVVVEVSVVPEVFAVVDIAISSDNACVKSHVWESAGSIFFACASMSNVIAIPTTANIIETVIEKVASVSLGWNGISAGAADFTEDAADATEDAADFTEDAADATDVAADATEDAAAATEVAAAGVVAAADSLAGSLWFSA